ncbi:MAG: hypothetical protein R3F61_12285 [Myxococcota bacterium]
MIRKFRRDPNDLIVQLLADTPVPFPTEALADDDVAPDDLLLLSDEDEYAEDPTEEVPVVAVVRRPLPYDLRAY